MINFQITEGKPFSDNPVGIYNEGAESKAFKMNAKEQSIQD